MSMDSFMKKGILKKSVLPAKEAKSIVTLNPFPRCAAFVPP
jgi:hypothetical protein